MGVKEEFRAPSHVFEREIERLGIPRPKGAITGSPGQLTGTWMNADHKTRDLIRLMIELKGNEITVHAFGACTPNPCDWGAVPGMVFAESVCSVPSVAFTSLYKFDFAEITLVGRLYKEALFVETFTHFIDHSGRADYFAMDVMTR
jgi:hypothetical protein